MSDRFLTFDEVQQLLKIPADELQQLLDDEGVGTVVKGGVVRFSESDVIKLTATSRWGEELTSPEPSTLKPGLPTGQTCEPCFTRPAPRNRDEDYGFVFLVDEDEEAAIEGEAYDGELPTEVIDVPEQISQDDLMSPTDLSPEQQEALELFSEMDMARVSEMGRKVAESAGEPDVLEAPELTGEPVATPEVSGLEAEPPVEEPIVLETPELTGEPWPGESIEPIAVTPTAFEPVENSESQEHVTPEPISEPTVEEVVEPVLEQKKSEFEFITEEAVASVVGTEISSELAEKLGQEIEVSDTYEMSQAMPEAEVTEHAGLATDEELEDRTEQPEPEAETVEPTPEPAPEETAAVPVEPLLEETDLPEPPARRGGSEDFEIPDLEEPEPILGAQTGQKVPAESMTGVSGPSESGAERPEDVDRLTPTTLSDAQAGELFDEIEREIEPKAVGETAVPADQASPDAADSAIAPMFGPEASGGSGAESDQVPVMSGESRDDQEQGRIEPEEEEVVTEDQKKEPEKQEPEEDVFEVYDLEEETAAAPVVPEQAEAEEEVIDLEDVSAESVDEMEAIEKSVEEEMEDIFGEAPKAPAPAPLAVGAEVDDFDLSIFKEGDTTTEDVATLEEVDLSAVMMASQSTEMSDVSTLPSAGPSRIDAITAPRGPSTLPMTLAVIISFVALLAAGMILVALSLSRSPLG